AAHRVQRGRERLPLQVAHVRLGGPAEDAVDVARRERLARVARAEQRRDLPAHRVEVARVVAGPLHAAALRTGPALDHERGAARVGVRLDAVVRGLAARERQAVAGADPRDVELAQADARLAHLVRLVGQRALRPQTRLEARLLLDLGGGLRELDVLAAVPVV